jgi:tripartite-type tricarboxylate transporter receptor subunit TctC
LTKLRADGIPAVAGFASARDDHTLLFSFAGIITINPLTYDKLPYDPARDVVPVVSVSDNFIGIGVSQSLNINSIGDLAALARSQPGKLNWAASPGNPLYAFAALQKSTGIDMVQVAYRDFRPALQDVSEGRIQAIATGVALMLPQVQAGKIKLLMVNNRERSPQVPDVPTAREAGFPELTLDGVVGFYGWRDMPVDLKDRIAADVRAVADPTIAARVATMGTVLAIRTPSEFAAVLQEQRARIADIARAMKPTQ